MLYREDKLIERIRKIRRNRTTDIAQRVLLVTPSCVEIENFPTKKPVTLFNPSIIVDDGRIKVFARIVMGYFTYASAVVEFEISSDDVIKRSGVCEPEGVIKAKVTLIPGTRYDMWGVEDPRVLFIDGKMVMTYCGRTINYFAPHPRTERTLPVTAVFRDGWVKMYVFRFSPEMRTFIISDKDAFVFKNRSKLYLFHRPHMLNEIHYMVLSEIPPLSFDEDGMREIVVERSKVVIAESEFESKLGWSTPPVEVDGKLVVLVHAVDRDGVAYKVFALSFDKEMNIIEVTPNYIMEPREIFELYGERPLTVFPCGAQVIDEFLVVSYGCADFSMGIAKIPLEKLLKELSKGKI